MPIVRYGMTFNMGNYESERIDFEDEVKAAESIEAAYQRCKTLVEQQHTQSRKGNTLEAHINQLLSRQVSIHRKIEALNMMHERAIGRYNDLRAILARHGVEVEEINNYYLTLEPLPPIVDDGQDDDDQADDDDL